MTTRQTLALLIAATLGGSAHAGPFDSLLDALKPKAQEAAAAQAAQPSAAAGQTPATPLDLTKIISKPMTARELFKAQGMYATMNMVQRMAADAKAGKGGMMDAMGVLTLDTGAMLRLASRMTASYLSFTALEQLMVSMSDDPRIMDNVSVDVPQVAALGQLQLQEDTLGVARFLVAMKAANLLVAESEQSLEAAKARYVTVMAEREKKAKLLGEAGMLVSGVFGLSEADLKANSAEDLAYLKGFEGKPLPEVLKDPLAAALIERELRRKYPAEYKSIIESEKEVATHYGAYSKTAVGTLSMLGFAAVFLNNVMDMSNRSNAHMLLLVPMAKDGAVELVGIAKNVVSALSKNDDLIEGTFAITVDGKTTTGVAASKLLKSLSTEQLDGFRTAMIGSSSKSYLRKLDIRSTDYAADILDRLVDRDTKESFAKTVYSVENPDMFSFKAAFAAKSAKSALKAVDPKVKSRVYEDSFDTKAEDVVEQVYGKLQNVVKTDVTKISNQDLRRIMLVQGVESLQIGSALVRLEQPGLQGLADRQEMTMAALPQTNQDTGKGSGTKTGTPVKDPKETKTPKAPKTPPKKPQA